MELGYLRILCLSNLKEHVETLIPWALLLGIFYLISIFLAERIFPQRSLLIFVFVTAAAFRLTLFPLYPSLSDDLYRYRWDGKVQQVGYNPYLVRPTDPQFAFLRNEAPGISAPEYAAVYGPVLEEVFWLSVSLTDRIVLLKSPFLLFDLGTILLLFRLLPVLGISPLRALVYAWSPLPVVEFAASGHNDALPVFAFVLALLFYEKKQGKLSLAALSCSALAKLYAGFLFPVFLLRTGWKRLWVPVLVAGVAFAPYLDDWRSYPDAVSVYMQTWRNNEGLFFFLRQFTATNWAAWRVYLVILAAAIVYCLVRKLNPARASFLILGTVLLFSPNVFPWYVTWIVPLLAIYPNPAYLFFTVAVFLSYHVLILYRTTGVWEEQTLFRLLEYVPFYALLVGGFIASRFRRPGTGRDESNGGAPIRL